ncbi:MAG: hypothetical protein KGL37_11135 [Acidobacteriota bacterium]|nr:hypothetical protein [Acidobacteriota bacterium]
MTHVVRFDCYKADLLAGQLYRRGTRVNLRDKSFQILAALLEHPGELVIVVAAGYGTTLIPALAADSFARREIVLRPLAGGTSRTIRLASRPGFPRPQALRALEKAIWGAVGASVRQGPR